MLKIKGWERMKKCVLHYNAYSFRCTETWENGSTGSLNAAFKPTTNHRQTYISTPPILVGKIYGISCIVVRVRVDGDVVVYKVSRDGNHWTPIKKSHISKMRTTGPAIFLKDIDKLING